MARSRSCPFCCQHEMNAANQAVTKARLTHTEQIREVFNPKIHRIYRHLELHPCKKSMSFWINRKSKIHAWGSISQYIR